MRAYSPNDELIVGTLEALKATARIADGSYNRDKDGKLTFEHHGGTEVWWDETKTMRSPDGETLYVCEDGKIWSESQIVLKDE